MGSRRFLILLLTDIFRANDSRVDAFLDGVTERLWAYHTGAAEPIDQREGGPRLLTDERMQAILEKIVSKVIHARSEPGADNTGQTVQINLGKKIIKAALFFWLDSFLPDLVVDEVLVCSWTP